MFRLAALCWLLGQASSLNPHFVRDCGGWKYCLETQSENDLPLTWFGAWNATIQPKLDRLLVTSAEQREGWSGDNGLLLVMAGDSTMNHQFQVLSEMLHYRSDFYPVQGADAESVAMYELTFGAPKNTPGSVTFIYIRVFEACVLSPSNPHLANAYAHYFGCGMHLFHMTPLQGPAMMALALKSWISYDTLLTERVKGIRKVNPGIKQIYATTHTIDEAKYTGRWRLAIDGYAARDPEYLDACKAKFNEFLPKDCTERGNVEQACLDTVFGERAVELLNARGLAAMKAAGVPVVPAHLIVAGEAWATPLADGRHYPHVVPLELFWFLTTLEGA